MTYLIKPNTANQRVYQSIKGKTMCPISKYQLGKKSKKNTGKREHLPIAQLETPCPVSIHLTAPAYRRPNYPTIAQFHFKFFFAQIARTKTGPLTHIQRLAKLLFKRKVWSAFRMRLFEVSEIRKLYYFFVSSN